MHPKLVECPALKMTYSQVNSAGNSSLIKENNLPEILFISSYPPRECGIATYSQDLIKALNNKFSHSFSLKVCALESGSQNYVYPKEVKLTLDTTDARQFKEVTYAINDDNAIQLVVVQHEFGLFHQQEAEFIWFLYHLNKPIILAFHTVLPVPDAILLAKVTALATVAKLLLVMTTNAAAILQVDYGIATEKIAIIPHGTHLVPHHDKVFLKTKLGLSDRKILSTFGLLGSGKGIETTLDSLPGIIDQHPTVLFLVIGKTHPSVVKSEGEKYRNALELKVKQLALGDHVLFINSYLPLNLLLEYLQLTDIYLFTSLDKNQAVSGTFSYAMSCGCPIISTPFAHALEVLGTDDDMFIDFQDSLELTRKVNLLLGNESLASKLSFNTLQRIIPSAWENSAVAHALLLQKTMWKEAEENGFTDLNFQYKPRRMALQFAMPEINLAHVKKMTTDFGIIQFSKINQPDSESGYTLDDNARSLIAMCWHYEQTGDESDLDFIEVYLHFIEFCLQPEGYFLNYVDVQQQFTEQNNTINLADASGRAIWAMGLCISKSDLLPKHLVVLAETIMESIMPSIIKVHSTRAMAFCIKGLYLYNLKTNSSETTNIIKILADRLVQMYWHESEKDWRWFECYMTYANSVLPEAMLCAWMETGEKVYKEIAKASFDFLLSLTFFGNQIKVISNKNWLQKGQLVSNTKGGEQPIDVAYSILALGKFYDVFQDPKYSRKMAGAFSWFLGNNHLSQIIYNPCTGGCFDGLEETQVNLNQGAESTISYLMARLTISKYIEQ
jgi:glycosyltransferase involved in cell wall biosynthesis